MINFLNKENLFNLTPDNKWAESNLYFYLALLIFVLSLLQWLLVRKFVLNKAYKNFAEKVFYFLFFASLTLSAITFFCREEVYLFSSNIFILIILSVFFIWLVYLLYYLIFVLPQEVKKFKKYFARNKYIPKASHKW